MCFELRSPSFQMPFTLRNNPLLSAPNLVSFSRIPMGALAWLRPLDPVFILGLMALAAASDVLDGWLERYLRARRGGLRLDEPSDGAWIDPLCDKTFMFLVLAAVMAARKSALFPLPLIATRELMQTVAALVWGLIPVMRERLDFRMHASVLGKAVTTGQFLTIGAAILGHPSQASLAVLTGVLGLVAGSDYIARAWRRRGARTCAS